MPSLTLLSKIKQIILITPTQLVASFVIALFIFLVEFGPIMIRAFESGSQVNAGDTNKTVSGYVLTFLQRLNEVPNAKVIAAGVVSAIAGIAIYAILVALYRIIIDIREEIEVDASITKKEALAKVLLTRFGIKILVAIGFGVFLLITLLFLIPYWMDLLSIFVYTGLKLSSAYYLVAGLFGLMMNIYILWIIAHFTWIYEESV
jgi:hypothetical protein